MAEILIEKVEPKTKKDGTPIAGESPKGRWQIWRVNDKYDYFSGATLVLEVGKTYNGTIETKTKDGYTNSTLIIKDHTPIISVDEDYHTGEVAPDFLQPEGKQTGDQLLMEEIQSFRKEINDRFDSLGHYLSSKLK